jgi:hypothetical protein
MVLMIRAMRCIACLAVLGACYSSTPAGAPPQQAAVRKPVVSASDPLAYLPGDSTVVAVIDVTRVRATPLWPIVADKFMGPWKSRWAHFKRECGFDLLEVATQVSIGVTGGPSTFPFTVVRGVPRDKFLACANRVFTNDVVFKDGVATGDGVTIGFANATTILFVPGTPDDLARALARGAPLHGSSDFAKSTEHVDTHRPVWVVFANSEVLSHFPVPNVHIDRMVGDADASNGLAASLRIHFASPAEAANVVAQAQRELGKVSGFVEEITVTAEDDEAVAHVVMTPEQLAQIAALLAPTP